MNIISLRKVHVVRLALLVSALLIGLVYWFSLWNVQLTSSVHSLGWNRSGLQARDKSFYLNDKPLRILSGAIHYFRVVPEYWEDRMLKLKAAGLNTLETYVPWNLHEEVRGVFKFDGNLDLRKYLKTATELGLYVIVRPGPYICAEWDLGGFPSWLLHDKNMKLRSSYQPYLDAIESYFARLFMELTDLQFQNGGPIIAFQVENEYGSFGDEQGYMLWLRQCILKNGVKEMLFTADNTGVKKGSLPGTLMTVNFKDKENGAKLFQSLREIQPDKPIFVAEFWTGWFDHWGEKHNTIPLTDMKEVLTYILNEGASVNFYMYHGGTNFGFMNGANTPYTPTINSYDYDAPVSESGELSAKFFLIRETLSNFVHNIPDPPPVSYSFAYGTVKIQNFLTLEDILAFIEPIMLPRPVTMEMLDINNHGGQGYGFIMYRKNIPKGNSTTLTIAGPVMDRALIILNGKEITTIDYNVKKTKIKLPVLDKDENVLDILVENLGRVNYGPMEVISSQRKGLNENVYLDGKKLEEWNIFPLEFKAPLLETIASSSKWKNEVHEPDLPGFYRAEFSAGNIPKDTFLNMQGWKKGVAFLNNFNLGRYWNIGPQKTLFIPAPLLKKGENSITVFELHQGNEHLTLIDKPLLE